MENQPTKKQTTTADTPVMGSTGGIEDNDRLFDDAATEDIDVNANGIALWFDLDTSFPEIENYLQGITPALLQSNYPAHLAGDMIKPALQLQERLKKRRAKNGEELARLYEQQIDLLETVPQLEAKLQNNARLLLETTLRLKQFKQHKESLNKTIRDLNGSKQSQGKTIRKLKKTKEQQSKTILKLKEKVKKADDSTSRMRKKLDKKTEKHKKQKAKNKTKEVEIQRLKEEVKRQTDTNGNLEKKKAKNHRKQKAVIQMKDGEIQGLKEKLDEQSKTNTKLSVDNQFLEKDLQILQATYNECKTNNVNEIETLRNEHEKLKTTHENLRQTHETVQKGYDQLQTTFSFTKMDLLKADEEIAKLKAELKRMQNENAEYSVKMENFNKLQITLCESIQELHSKFDSKMQSAMLQCAMPATQATGGATYYKKLRAVSEMIDIKEGTDKTHLSKNTDATLLREYKINLQKLRRIQEDAGSTSARPLRSLHAFVRWFNKHHADPGETFDTMNENDVYNKLLNYANDVETTTRLSARTIASMFRTCNRALAIQGRFCAALYDRLRKDYFNAFDSVAKIQKERGEYNGCRPILLKDIKHMIHCLVEQSKDLQNKFLDFPFLQSLVAMMISTTSGRRFLEVMSLSLQSLDLEVIEAVLPDKSTRKFRILRYYFCESKQKGAAPRDDKIFATDDTPLEENTILFILLLLQYRGIIKSAVDVYNGNEKLETLDSKHFESPELYSECIREGMLRYSSAMSAILLQNFKDDVPPELMNAKEEDVEYLKAHPGANYDVFVQELRIRHGKQCFFHQYHEGIATSEPLNHKQFWHMMNRFGKACGYTSDVTQWMGLTGGRKGYVNLVVEANGENSRIALFLDSRLLNKSQVRFGTYTDHNAQRRSLPANMYFKSVTEMERDWLLKHKELIPAYDRKGFFCEDVKPCTHDLPNNAVFLNIFSKDVTSTSVPLLVTRICPFVDCNERFGATEPLKTYGDFKNHYLNACEHRSGYKIACDCGKYTREPTDFKHYLRQTGLGGKTNRSVVQAYRKHLQNCSLTKQWMDAIKLESPPPHNVGNITKKLDIPHDEDEQTNAACDQPKTVPQVQLNPDTGDVDNQAAGMAHASSANKSEGKNHARAQTVKPGDLIKEYLESKGFDWYKTGPQELLEQTDRLIAKGRSLPAKTVNKPSPLKRRVARPANHKLTCPSCNCKLISINALLVHRRENKSCPAAFGISREDERKQRLFLKNLTLLEKGAKLDPTGKSFLGSDFEVFDEEIGRMVKIGRWLQRQKDKYDRNQEDFTEEHLNALKDIGVPWAWYAPKTDMRKVDETKTFNKCAALVKEFIELHKRLPGKLDKLGEFPVGQFLRRAHDTYKAKRQHYPKDKLKALANAGVHWAKEPPKPIKSRTPIARQMELLRNYFNGPTFSATRTLPAQMHIEDGHNLGMWLTRQRGFHKKNGQRYQHAAEFASSNFTWILEAPARGDCTAQVMATPGLLRNDACILRQTSRTDHNHIHFTDTETGLDKTADPAMATASLLTEDDCFRLLTSRSMGTDNDHDHNHNHSDATDSDLDKSMQMAIAQQRGVATPKRRISSAENYHEETSKKRRNLDSSNQIISCI